MKKIVGIVAAASLVAGLAFADGPTANLNVAEFTGNAQVQWGVDLDAGQTGFKNSEYMKFVINLFDAGTKNNEAGDVWAELEMKAGNTGWWAHRIHQTDANVDYNADAVNGGVASTISFDITAAKLHFGDIFVGIQNGDTQTGSYKFDGAIRSADNGNAEWLKNVGPAGYTQGIVAGYDNSNLKAEVDFRSAPDFAKKDGKLTTDNPYTSNYAVAAEVALKDSNEWVEGLFVDLGGSMTLTKGNNYKSTEYKVDDKVIANEAKEVIVDTTTLGYSANAGYKLKIDDKNFLKPAVGFTGSLVTGEPRNTSNKTVTNANDLVAGVIFGWGATKDANAGVYYFDNDDRTKKVTPGVSVVAKIPLASKTTTTNAAGTTSETVNNKALAIIVPSFYTGGELVEGLTAAVYSEMALLRGESTNVTGTNEIKYNTAKDTSDTFALALAAAVKYDIKADDITITPQAGFRFVNACYEDNEISKYAPGNKFFADLGKQKTVTDATSKRKDLYDGGFFNLKAGVNVNGLIKNTDFFLVYESANLMNGIDYSTFKNDDGTARKFYNVKAGTLNVGCKISL